jgi:hypothetical protein
LLLCMDVPWFVIHHSWTFGWFPSFDFCKYPEQVFVWMHASTLLENT